MTFVHTKRANQLCAQERVRVSLHYITCIVRVAWCDAPIEYKYINNSHTHTHRNRDTKNTASQMNVVMYVAKPSTSRTTNKQTNPPSNTHFSTIDELRKIMSWKPVILYQQVTDDVYFYHPPLNYQHDRVPEKKKINEVHFLCWQYTNIHTVPWSRCMSFCSFYFFFFSSSSFSFHQWMSSTSSPLSSFHQFGFVCVTFSRRIFLVIYFPFPISSNFCAFYSPYTLADFVRTTFHWNS